MNHERVLVEYLLEDRGCQQDSEQEQGVRQATERKGAVQGWERAGCTSQRGPPLSCLGDSARVTGKCVR